MAYILGLIVSDGAVEDCRKSSRTCYLSITNTDRPLLLQVRKELSSNHKLEVRKQMNHSFGDKTYLCGECFHFRIANKQIFQDLIDLGVRPRKSLTAILPPNIPNNLFSYFLRGYFDGDGCLNLSLPPGRKTTRIKVIYTSGSKKLLDQINQKLEFLINTSQRRVYKNGRAYRLIYGKKDSLKILEYMYGDLDSAPFLKRKYDHYKSLNLPYWPKPPKLDFGRLHGVE